MKGDRFFVPLFFISFLGKIVFTVVLSVVLLVGALPSLVNYLGTGAPCYEVNGYIQNDPTKSFEVKGRTGGIRLYTYDIIWYDMDGEEHIKHKKNTLTKPSEWNQTTFYVHNEKVYLDSHDTYFSNLMGSLKIAIISGILLGGCIFIDKKLMEV